MKTLPFLALLPLALSGIIPAQGFEHESTGFGLTLSDDFVIDENVPRQPQYEILVGVLSASGNPAPVAGERHLCQAGFMPFDENAGMTQKEINAFIATQEWSASIRATLSAVMTLDYMLPAKITGIHGAEIIGRPIGGADDIRLVLTLLETPAGRIGVSCVATVDTMDAMLPTFRAIRDGITAPR